jgi:hypothetical protein
MNYLLQKKKDKGRIRRPGIFKECKKERRNITNIMNAVYSKYIVI